MLLFVSCLRYSNPSYNFRKYIFDRLCSKLSDHAYTLNANRFIFLVIWLLSSQVNWTVIKAVIGNHGEQLGRVGSQTIMLITSPLDWNSNCIL